MITKPDSSRRRSRRPSRQVPRRRSSGWETDSADHSLAGRLLVATPSMGDPRFVQAVIYICAHTPEGAMGLVLNRPLSSPPPNINRESVIHPAVYTHPHTGLVTHAWPDTATSAAGSMPIRPSARRHFVSKAESKRIASSAGAANHDGVRNSASSCPLSHPA